MKRWEFYRTYWRITDRSFADRTIWTAHDREMAWRKGQRFASKRERKAFLAAQYLMLFGAIWCLAAGKHTLCRVLLAAHLLDIGITDFSVVKMELLYGIYRRKNLFSQLLYQNFLGKTDGLWCAVKPLAKSRVSGFVRVGRGKLRVRYRVVFRKGHEDASIVVTPFGIRIRSREREYRLDDPSITLEEAARQIAGELHG